MDEPDIHHLMGTIGAMDTRLKRLESKVFEGAEQVEPPYLPGVPERTDATIVPKAANAADFPERPAANGVPECTAANGVPDPAEATTSLEPQSREHSVPVMLRKAYPGADDSAKRKSEAHADGLFKGANERQHTKDNAHHPKAGDHAHSDKEADHANRANEPNRKNRANEENRANRGDRNVSPESNNESAAFRLNIGRVLNVAGVCFLVVGAALLVMYSWQFLGAFIKVAIGLAVAAAMVWGGEKLEQREQNKWYGQGLIGGGYSLAYFLVYAMQNIAGLKTIDSQILDSVLLLALAAGCMRRAIKKRSETIAILSTLLAFITLSLSTITTYSVVASAVLLLGLAAVVIQMRWLGVFAFSAIGSYLTFSLFTNPQIVANYGATGAGLCLSASFLILYWIVQNALCFMLAADRGHKENLIVAISICNALAFVTFGLSMMSAHYSDFNYLFLFVTGVLYLASSPMVATRSTTLANVVTLIGLPLVTASIPLKLDPLAVPAVLLLELALLVWAGLRFNLTAFRAFAGFVAVMLLGHVFFAVLPDNRIMAMGAIQFQWRVLIGTLALIGFGLSSLCYRVKRFEHVQTSFELSLGHFLYFGAAAAIAWALAAHAAAADAKALWWTIEGVVMLLLVHRSSRLFHHLCAAGYLAWATWWLLGAYAMGNFSFGGTLMIGRLEIPQIEMFLMVSGLVIAACYRYLFDALYPQSRRALYHAYSITAIIAMGLCCSMRFGFSNVSVLLACGLAAVLAIAVLIRDGVMVKLATASFALALIAAMTNFTHWDWFNILPVIGIVYGVSALFGWAKDQGGITCDAFLGGGQAISVADATWMRGCFGLAGSVMLTLAFGSLLHGQIVSVAWALEGIALIAIGFKFDELVYRFAGLATFALLAGKLLFIDLADAATVARIAAFMITGLAFLAGSYAYAWYRKNNKPAEQR